MRTIVIMLLGSAALAGCAAEPHIVNATPQGVSLAYAGVETHQASAAATIYCDQFSRFATLRQIAPMGDENVAIFGCTK